jgi:hypothetical protein
MHQISLHHHHHGPGPELRAFAAFYGAATAGTILLHAVAAVVLPSALAAEYNAFLWTLGFLIRCSGCAWIFERNRKRSAH